MISRSSKMVICACAIFWSAAAAAPSLAQGPVPTPVPVSGEMQPGPDYARLKVQVDQWFDFVFELFDRADSAMSDMFAATESITDLLVTGYIQVGDQTYTTDDLIANISQPIAALFAFRCYVDSPLVNWALIFLAWMVLVMLIKFAISALPFMMQLFDFIWGKLVDMWQSIPFV